MAKPIPHSRYAETRPNANSLRLSEIKFAKRANDLTGFKNWNLLDTLAVVYAASGDFESAATFERQAIQYATEKNQDTAELNQRLELFLKQKRFIEQN